MYSRNYNILGPVLFIHGSGMIILSYPAQYGPLAYYVTEKQFFYFFKSSLIYIFFVTIKQTYIPILILIKK